MRIGILALLHESNTFIATRTTMRHFEEDVLLVGDAIRERFNSSHHELGGFLAGVEESGFEAVPIFAARAVPSGPIEDATYSALRGRLLDELGRAAPLDGLLVAPHGATVSDSVRDVDGDWLSRVRQLVGETVPILGTLDPHANLSPQMVAATNALIAYRTNPHLDQRQRGLEAARLLARTLRGAVWPVQAAAFPPLAINIERQLTSDPPCEPLYRLADEQLKLPGILANSIILGFPYADVEEMGSATLVVTNNDQELAKRSAMDLAAAMWSRRTDFVGQLIEINDALRASVALPGPVGLLDMGDNVGGGSPGDGTFLAHAIRQERLTPAFACLYDPESVQQVIAADRRVPLGLRVGGKSDDWHGQPYEDQFEVLGVFDGKFTEFEARHGGFNECDQGMTAVVRGSSGVTFMLTSRRMPPFSLRQLTAFGVDPLSFRLLVIKGVHAPVAAYRQVCGHMIRVNTPGCTTADVESLSYRFRRRPLFPFETEAEFRTGGNQQL